MQGGRALPAFYWAPVHLIAPITPQRADKQIMTNIRKPVTRLPRGASLGTSIARMKPHKAAMSQVDHSRSGRANGMRAVYHGES